ncbi:alanine dehydrogenase [Neptuniibacter caesariensis]|uniref:Alanine dehydrogenase n=1 Tax=Neptuniibacter caesariensis TaxID=207954 RepID=A0A7U8C756_NEPCE|nr:alanine dehydrogenase [Neptuniibacter caesariensis]EAR62838.1 alanine dehydrogenase [Oceanospirillum sp. MED92] [Neptuniibacter caesariensis]
MLIGVPTEIKTREYRVGLTPSGVKELCSQGHDVIIQKGAGEKIGFFDAEYQTSGAEIVETAGELWSRAQMIIKVKEPQPEETARLKPEHLLFTYLHLAAERHLTESLQNSGCTAIAYETITDHLGHLPLLAPMSEVAGRMSVQAGAHCLEIAQQGRGVLLGGVPGVAPGKVIILGGGVVGTNAAQMATGLGAEVTIFDKSPQRLRELDSQFHGRIKTCYSTTDNVQQAIAEADLIIGAVLIPGAAAPKLVTKADLGSMQKGSVIVDVAIDQGGCFETSRPTTHDDPTFIEQGIVHYCVANMPGAVARTSTLALTNATLPYICRLANAPWQTMLKQDPLFAKGLNVHRGDIFCEGVAKAFDLDFRPIDSL